VPRPVSLIVRRLTSQPGGASHATAQHSRFSVAGRRRDPQGERTHREYLDYLISLTGISLEEFEKRYRLNLRRSDLERSNPVQQNIETLQRFFTDSYQSVDDPFAIAPDRKAGTPEVLITKFPLEAAGPFFLEYEEWLERESRFTRRIISIPERRISGPFGSGCKKRAK
jgi:hypothetical protein